MIDKGQRFLAKQSPSPFAKQLSHVRALAAGAGGLGSVNHLANPIHDKLSDESFPRGGSPPTPVTPTPTTVQQLLRRAQIRRGNERCTPDPHDANSSLDPNSIKRPRVLSPPLNNNDATPTDFSMVKSNHHLTAKLEQGGTNGHLHGHDQENNGPQHLDSAQQQHHDNIKCEPLELTGGGGGNNNGGPGNNHNEDSSDSGAAASDRPPASASSNEHENEHDHPPTPNYLAESKLFASTPGGFNFSMAALTTDHSPLSGKRSQVPSRSPEACTHRAISFELNPSFLSLDSCLCSLFCSSILRACVYSVCGAPIRARRSALANA